MIKSNSDSIWMQSSQRWKMRGLRFASLVLFALIWELTALNLQSLLLPSFTETVPALARLLVTPALWEALWVSNQAMVVGFTLAAVAGVSLGFLMARVRAVERFVDPYLTILWTAPMTAMIPLVVMAFGLGFVSRIVVIFLFAFVVVVVNTRAGLRMTDPAWIEMAQAFGATERQLWIRVLVPATLPAIMTGLRLGLIRSVSGMITVELLLLALGLGRLIMDFRTSYRADDLFATIAVVVAESLVLMRVFKWLELRAAPWREQGALQ